MSRSAQAWVAGAVLALVAAPAGADVFVVDTRQDLAVGTCVANPGTLATVVGTCSLRRALTAANATAGADLILFAPAVFTDASGKVIEVASPLPDATGSVELNGTSQGLVTERVQGIVIRAATGVADLLSVQSGLTALNDLALENGALSIEGSSRLVFDQSVDGAFAQAIGGTGSLTKLGDARLVLGGTNDYGDTRIDAGTLQVDTRSLPGPGRLIQDSAVLVFDQDATDPEDFFGAISGSGRVEKIGAGTLYLRTANSYGGGTLVSAGTLKGFAGSGTAGSLQGNVVDDAKLVFEQAADGTFTGSISGSGSVDKTGAGLLILTGTNTYAGGTAILAGNLQGSATAIPGSVSIAAGSKLVFDQAATGTSTGVLSGAGSLEKRGTGALTLAGANTYTGGTSVTAGSLIGTTQSLQGAIDVLGGATLVFDQSFAGSFDGLLGNAGALEKRGAGTLRLTADLSVGGFSGATTVRGGRLEVGAPATAFLPGAVDVLSGAALGGIGEVGGLATAHSGGAISPGSSIGTLTVGSAHFEAGSALEIEVLPSGAADLLVVTGAATVDLGAGLRILPGPGTYPAIGTSVSVLQAGTKTGLFDAPPPFAFLDVLVTQTSTEVQIQVQSNGNTLEGLAETSNQREVGAALDAAHAAGDPDLDVVFGELNPLLVSDIPDALDAMSGEQLTEFATARLMVGDRFHASIQERIRGADDREPDPLLAGGDAGLAALSAFAPLGGGPAGASIGPRLAAAAMQISPAAPAAPAREPGLSGWLDGYGIFGHVSGSSGSHDFDPSIWGLSAGFDARLAEHWIAGVAAGYAHSSLDFDGLAGDADADTAQAALYGGYLSPRIEAGAAFRFAWNHMTTTREIDFPPPSTLSRSADASFDGIDLGGHAEVALNLLDVGRMTLQPVASLTYTHLQQDAFDESGADSLSISADEQDLDSLVSGLGARLRGRFQLDEDLWLRPELRARWLHEFGDTERKLDARIGGTPGASYSVRGAELARDSAAFGVSWTVVRASRLHVFAEYDLAWNPDGIAHVADVGVRILW